MGLGDTFESVFSMEMIAPNVDRLINYKLNGLYNIYWVEHIVYMYCLYVQVPERYYCGNCRRGPSKGRSSLLP